MRPSERRLEEPSSFTISRTALPTHLRQDGVAVAICSAASACFRHQTRRARVGPVSGARYRLPGCWRRARCRMPSATTGGALSRRRTSCAPTPARWTGWRSCGGRRCGRRRPPLRLQFRWAAVMSSTSSGVGALAVEQSWCCWRRQLRREQLRDAPPSSASAVSASTFHFVSC